MTLIGHVGEIVNGEEERTNGSVVMLEILFLLQVLKAYKPVLQSRY